MASLWAVPSFASWSTISLHVIPIHALIFSIVLLCLVYTIWWSMANMSNMVGWLSWDNGVLTWLLMRCMPTTRTF